MTCLFRKIQTPVGNLIAFANEKALVGLIWANTKTNGLKSFGGAAIAETERHPILEKTETQLREYFEGTRKTFDLPIALQGTPAQIEIWKLLTKIEKGQTKTYGELARSIGKPKACRFVGSAVGRNPLSIVVPCHRVIGQNKSLTGFAGGLLAKKSLLIHEGHRIGDKNIVL